MDGIFVKRTFAHRCSTTKGRMFGSFVFCYKRAIASRPVFYQTQALDIISGSHYFFLSVNFLCNFCKCSASICARDLLMVTK